MLQGRVIDVQYKAQGMPALFVALRRRVGN